MSPLPQPGSRSQVFTVPGASGGSGLPGAKMKLDSLYTRLSFDDGKIPVGNVVVWDDAGFADAANHRFVIPAGQAGRYMVTARANLYPDGVATSGYTELSIRNGALSPAGDYDRTYNIWNEINIGELYPKCSVELVLAAGAILTLWVINSLDITLNVDTNIASGTYLALMKIG